MSRSRLIFFAIIGAALLLVVGLLVGLPAIGTLAYPLLIHHIKILVTNEVYFLTRY